MMVVKTVGVARKIGIYNGINKPQRNNSNSITSRRSKRDDIKYKRGIIETEIRKSVVTHRRHCGTNRIGGSFPINTRKLTSYLCIIQKIAKYNI